MFGELGLIYDGLPRQATVALESDQAEVWCLRKDDFDRLVRSDEKLMNNYQDVLYSMYESGAKLPSSSARKQSESEGSESEDGAKSRRES